MTKLKLTVDLDELFPDEYRGSLADEVRDEVKRLLRSEVRAAMKADVNFAELIRSIKQRAFSAALKDITVSDAMVLFGER